MRWMIMAAFIVAQSPAFAAEPLRIEIKGENDDELRQSLMEAAGVLEGGPEQAKYIELTIPTNALHLFEVNGKPTGPRFCSMDEGKGNRRVRGVTQLSASGTTPEFTRYSLSFNMGAPSARPWTDLACHYYGSGLVLMLRGHFVARDLKAVETLDVELTAVAP